MRNLKLRSVFKVTDPSISQATHLAIDPDLNEIFLVNGQQQLLKINPSQENSLELLVDLKISSDSKDEIVSLEFILEERALCVVFSSGNVLSYNISSNILDPVTTIVGDVDCVSWSPDQEYVVVTSSKSDRLTVFNKLFDAIVEHTLNPSEYGSEQLVSVGWGSKETQFHGSLGKSAREKKAENLSILQVDDGLSRVSWRGDGQFFAVSSADLQLNSRVVRIYDRDCTLQFTSEVKEGLEHLLSWKPSGEFFVVTQQKFQRHSVSFIEKNGLYFNGFDLPFEFGSILLKQLTWSLDSKVLSVLLEQVDSKKQLLLLYSYANGHWYLKQVLHFEPLLENICALLWDPIQVGVLHVLASTFYMKFNFNWSVTQSQDATVAVIDGKCLLMNPFGVCVVPPPMSAFSFEFNSFIRDVSFETNDNFIVQLVDSSLVKLSLPSQSQAPVENGDSTNDGVFKVTVDHNVGQNKNLLSVNSYLGHVYKDFKCDKFACHLTAATNEFFLVQDKNNLCEIVYHSSQGITSLATEFKAVSAIAVDRKSKNLAAIEFENGTIYSFDCSTGKLEPWLDENSQVIKFPQVCSTIAVVDKLVFGLSASYTLYCNNQAILKNLCTSFTVVNDCFMAYTTTTHKLHISSIIRPGWMASLSDESLCPAIPIERGALIVTSSPESGSVVLQARRGNLEVLYPRTLLWSLVQSMMDDHKFLQAFELMRKHRMDFNLLLDFDFEKFMGNLDEFVKQIGAKSVDYLVLFISNLSNECKTLPVLHGTPEKTGPFAVCKNTQSNRVEQVCAKIQQIAKLDYYYFTDVILATLVKCDDYEPALNFIKSMESLPDGKKRMDDAFQFMFYFIDVNELFKHALGTYDDEIVLMVASKSQKDPKEYNKLLSDLREVECEEYRRFKIDILLNRPVRALENILKCEGPVYREETFKLIVNHRLYKEAIAILSNREASDELCREIWSMYGDYLLAKRYYLEAGIAYNRSGNNGQSIKAYQLAGNWNLALRECEKLQDETALKNLSSALIHSLSTSGEFVDAAFIAQNYLDDTERAIHLLISGREWDHAARMVSQVTLRDAKSGETYQMDLLNGLKDQASSLTGLIESQCENVKSNCHRLLIVREQKALLQLKREQGNLSDDDMSQVSSIRSSKNSTSSSSSASITGRSSSGSLKTKKSAVVRDARQLFKLKPGSRYEDVAAVIACKESISLVQKLQKEVSSLLVHLVESNQMTLASELRRKFISLLDLVKDTIKLVWVDGLLESFFLDENTCNRLPEDFSDIIAKPRFKETSWDLVLLA